MLRDEEIRKILVTSTLPEEQINKLIQEALDKGGKDNITITIIRITESPFGEINASFPPKQKIKLKSFQLVLIILILALLSLYLYPFIKGKRNDSNMPEKENQLDKDTLTEPNDNRTTDLRLDSFKSEVTPKADIPQIKPNENDRSSNARTKDSIITEVKYESSVIDSTNTEE
jgi:flagellar biosynthesis/type III secretory pathway M-ring protein FliF/YscJ